MMMMLRACHSDKPLLLRYSNKGASSRREDVHPGNRRRKSETGVVPSHRSELSLRLPTARQQWEELLSLQRRIALPHESNYHGHIESNGRGRPAPVPGRLEARHERQTFARHP